MYAQEFFLLDFADFCLCLYAQEFFLLDFADIINTCIAMWHGVQALLTLVKRPPDVTLHFCILEFCHIAYSCIYQFLKYQVL